MAKTNDEWWCGLHVEEKERIASKIKKYPIHYPHCTSVWNELDDQKKTWVRNHCTNRHGVITLEWREGKMYSE